MKTRVLNIIFVLLLSGLFHQVCAQEINRKVIDDKGREKLLGKIDKAGLNQGSFKSWFTKQYETYPIDLKTVLKFERAAGNYSIKIFMGTWCGDSRREVPRFYKILEAVNFPSSQLTVIAVDNKKPNYKKSPGGEEQGLNIVKVPTFIFFQDGKEINRIVEFPVESLEKDIENIIMGKQYVPNYSNLGQN